MVSVIAAVVASCVLLVGIVLLRVVLLPSKILARSTARTRQAYSISMFVAIVGVAMIAGRNTSEYLKLHNW